MSSFALPTFQLNKTDPVLPSRTTVSPNGAGAAADTVPVWNGTAWVMQKVASAQVGFVFSSYTPTWTSTGTQPVLSNGTITGKYLALGKFVCGSIALTFGSGTTFGTGSYLFSVPVALGASFGTNAPLATAVLNPSGGSVYSLLGIVGAGAILLITQASPGTIVSATNPVALASGDKILFNFAYESA